MSSVPLFPLLLFLSLCIEREGRRGGRKRERRGEKEERRTSRGGGRGHDRDYRKAETIVQSICTGEGERAASHERGVRYSRVQSCLVNPRRNARCVNRTAALTIARESQQGSDARTRPFGSTWTAGRERLCVAYKRVLRTCAWSVLRPTSGGRKRQSHVCLSLVSASESRLGAKIRTFD